MSGIVVAYVALLAATAAAASSNGTMSMSASLPGLLTDPCALGCLTAGACGGKDKSCLCDNLDAVTSDASRGCMRDRCPNLQADDVFGQLRGECSGKKMATDKGDPGKASLESLSSHSVGSSPAVNSVDTASISSLLVSSSPLPSATDGVTTTVSASTPLPPPASSPAASTRLPSAIPNTYSLSTLPSELSALVVATSAPETSSTAGTAGSTASSSSKDTPNSTAANEQEPSSHDAELSVAAKAGIGISVAVACLGIVAALLVFGWRRRRRDRDSGLDDDPTSWLRHAGEKHQTLQAVSAFEPTRQSVGSGVGGTDDVGHDGAGVGGLEMSLDPSSDLTYLSLGAEPSHEDEIHGIGVALSSDIYESLDSQTLVAEDHSETRLGRFTC